MKHDQIIIEPVFQPKAQPNNQEKHLLVSSLGASLLSAIKQPDIAPLFKRVIISLWCYLRDMIFEPKAFISNDPFASESIETTFANISHDDKVKGLIRALKHADPLVKAAAYLFIQATQLQDKRLLKAVQTYQSRLLFSA